MNANNIVNLVGRLTKDPELRYTPNGVAVASFTLAVNRPFAKDDQQSADFINCVVWRKLAENLANYCSKGSLISLVGSLQSRSYEDQSGKRVFVTEVVAENIQYISTRNNQSSNQSSQHNEQTYQDSNPFNQYGNFGFNDMSDPFADDGLPIDISDDDLPF